MWFEAYLNIYGGSGVFRIFRINLISATGVITLPLCGAIGSNTYEPKLGRPRSLRCRWLGFMSLARSHPRGLILLVVL